MTKEELGHEFDMNEAKLLGAYNHFYDDCVFNDKFSTHYVALAYKLEIKQELKELLLNIQYQNFQWFETENLKTNPLVHTYTKRYFE